MEGEREGENDLTLTCGPGDVIAVSAQINNWGKQIRPL